jgi:hypothetical protein
MTPVVGDHQGQMFNMPAIFDEEGNENTPSFIKKYL